MGEGRWEMWGSGEPKVARDRSSSHLTPHTSHLHLMLPLTLLIVGAVLSLPLTAVGLPGTWAFLAGVGIWKSFDPAAGVSWGAISTGVVLALIAELLEWGLASRYTSKYGGSRRAGWGALIGGIVGAVVGVPIPVLGSIVGSFVGAFVGALAAEYSVHGEHDRAGRVAWGALIGRVVATGMKVGLGVVVVVIVIASVIW